MMMCRLGRVDMLKSFASVIATAEEAAKVGHCIIIIQASHSRSHTYTHAHIIQG